jgi:hypothetical protein
MHKCKPSIIVQESSIFEREQMFFNEYEVDGIAEFKRLIPNATINQNLTKGFGILFSSIK